MKPNLNGLDLSKFKFIGVKLKRKQLLIDGFDFDKYEYKCDLIFKSGLVLKNCKKLGDMAYAENKDGDVIAVRFEENKGVQIRRIEQP